MGTNNKRLVTNPLDEADNYEYMKDEITSMNNTLAAMYFSGFGEKWDRFLENIQDGDEVWYGWVVQGMTSGEGKYVLLRNGKCVDNHTVWVS